MLVLTRKMQERIQIGNNITITILRVKGSTVRVGIEAPREVRVIRGELSVKEEDGAMVEAEIPIVAEECESETEEGPSFENPSAVSTMVQTLTLPV